MNFPILQALRLWLESIHPLGPWAALTLAIMAAVYAVRRWLPQAWVKLENTIPEGVDTPISNILLALPSVAFGAAWAAFTSGTVSPGMAFKGAIAGGLAPVLHHLLKASPLPYRGFLRDVSWKWLGVGAVLFAVACGATQDKGKIPQFTDAESACAAASELRATAKEIECGKKVAGDCSSDGIVEAQRKETKECLQTY